MTPLQFDIPAVIRQKAPKAHVPAFIIRYLERITHVKQMNAFLRAVGQPFVVVANKHDKIKKSQWEPNLALIRETLELPEEVPIISFSAEKGLGKEELLQVILDHVSEVLPAGGPEA